MAKRKDKMEIVFTTIKVAGYSESKQMTNAISICVMSFDEDDLKSLIDKERQKMEEALQKHLSEGLVAKTKVVKQERKYIDGIICSEKQPQHQEEGEK